MKSGITLSQHGLLKDAARNLEVRGDVVDRHERSLRHIERFQQFLALLDGPVRSLSLWKDGMFHAGERRHRADAGSNYAEQDERHSHNAPRRSRRSRRLNVRAAFLRNDSSTLGHVGSPTLYDSRL